MVMSMWCCRLPGYRYYHLTMRKRTKVMIMTPWVFLCTSIFASGKILGVLHSSGNSTLCAADEDDSSDGCIARQVSQLVPDMLQHSEWLCDDHSPRTAAMAYLDYILFVHQKKPATTTKSLNEWQWYLVWSGQYLMDGVWNMELLRWFTIHKPCWRCSKFFI